MANMEKSVLRRELLTAYADGIITRAELFKLCNEYGISLYSELSREV